MLILGTLKKYFYRYNQRLKIIIRPGYLLAFGTKILHGQGAYCGLSTASEVFLMYINISYKLYYINYILLY